MIKKYKIKIISLLIVAMTLNITITNYAGEWIVDMLGYRYFYDENTFATGWRWIDVNNDSVAECYRFTPEGYLVINATTSDGKEVNDKGQWVLNGQVQQVYTMNWKPLASNTLGILRDDKSTTSTMRIYAKKQITTEEETKESSNSKSKSKKTAKPKGNPNAVFSPSETGRIISLRANINKSQAAGPKATASDGITIDTMAEDEPKYLEESDMIYIGKDMKDLVVASNKFTKSVQNVKVYGGDVWEEAMLLSGNNSSVKFNMEKYNWFRFEIAHQTHGESTKDTYVYVELYIGNVQVAAYDSFNDDEPEIVDEWLDDGDKTITLKVVVTGDALGRKVYIRNARARKLKTD